MMKDFIKLNCKIQNWGPIYTDVSHVHVVHHTCARQALRERGDNLYGASFSERGEQQVSRSKEMKISLKKVEGLILYPPLHMYVCGACMHVLQVTVSLLQMLFKIQNMQHDVGNIPKNYDSKAILTWRSSVSSVPIVEKQQKIIFELRNKDFWDPRIFNLIFCRKKSNQFYYFEMHNFSVKIQILRL